MKRPLLAGNWKMNTSPSEGIKLYKELLEGKKKGGFSETLEWLVLPPYTHLAGMLNLGDIQVGAQNCSHALNGAYTGEISVEMLKELGCRYVLVGHSERRQYFKESAEELIGKVVHLHGSNCIPIFCVGETWEQREKGLTNQVLENQINEVLGQFKRITQEVVLAYEPVWAIGTGKTASAEQAQEAHSFIRDVWKRYVGDTQALATRILYGGSMKPENAEELLSQPDIDGGLIGGAALNAEAFLQIARHFPK
ncbi:MAG: triose-phosphate isomerase [Bacteroidetes bacterium]|nr:triose-phosphate isomerase [Bacteroidota bacterium]